MRKMRKSVVRILVHTVCGCQDLGVGVREERAEWMGVATPLHSRSTSTWTEHAFPT